MASSSAPSANAGATPKSTDSTSAQSPEKISAASGSDQKASATTPNAPSETPAAAPTQQQHANNADDDDDDESDFDELDEVLDDFKPKPTPAPAQPDAAQAPSADDFDEEAFLRQLEQDMANMMGGASNDPTGSSAAQADPEFLDQDAETFAKYLEESGVTPSDFLKQLVGDVMMKGEDGDDSTTAATAGSSSSAAPPPAAAAAAAATPAGGNNAAPETFNDTIQRTIERMKESGDKATAAASEDDVSDDLVAQLIKAIEAGAGDGDEGDLTKMFMGMMEQLSNKEILYEPMKELDTKFGPWIAENKGKGKVSDEDMARYEKQAGVVALIVTKFEEKGYSDEDPKCREYVWEKMQEMQAAGNPPDELISAPWMEDLKGPGGAGGAPECPQQ